RGLVRCGAPSGSGAPALAAQMLGDRLEGLVEEFPYAVQGGTDQLVRTVLKTLALHVSAGEWEHLKSRVPNSFAALLP
ncbi:hypothetical protein ACWDRX_27690, partial [Streptomyces nigra]